MIVVNECHGYLSKLKEQLGYPFLDSVQSPVRIKVCVKASCLTDMLIVTVPPPFLVASGERHRHAEELAPGQEKRGTKVNE